jgi:hypothetical protein
MSSRTYQGRPLNRPDEEIFDQGLAFHLDTLLDRRRMLKLIGFTGVAAALFAAGCGSSNGGSQGSASASPTTGGATGDCVAIPEETAGPYPGDGSNGPDVLSQSGIVRSDTRSSFGQFSGTAEGVPLTIRLTILDASNACVPLAGAAIYLWHCLLLGAMAAQPLRGLSRPGGGRRRREQDRDLADRHARGRLQRGVRDLGLRAERPEPPAGEPGHGQRVRRRRWRAPARDRRRERPGRVHRRAHRPGHHLNVAGLVWWPRIRSGTTARR